MYRLPDAGVINPNAFVELIESPQFETGMYSIRTDVDDPDGIRIKLGRSKRKACMFSFGLFRQMNFGTNI